MTCPKFPLAKWWNVDLNRVRLAPHSLWLLSVSSELQMVPELQIQPSAACVDCYLSDCLQSISSGLYLVS